jgi:hypothetical protein
LGGTVTAEDKKNLAGRLRKLADKLDRYLGREYGIDVDKQKAAYAKWRAGHKPFHWFAEFYGTLKAGGFDIVIGNPPYVVYSPDKVGYKVEPANFKTLSAKNLYAFVFERSTWVAKPAAPISLIVQLTVLSSENLAGLQDVLINRGPVLALPFPRRPESVFEGVEMPVAIVLSTSGSENGFVTSRVRRFYTEERSKALAVSLFTRHSVRLDGHRIAKMGSKIENSSCQKIAACHRTLGSLAVRKSDWFVYYQEACRYWVKACDFLPSFERNGVEMEPPHGRTTCFNSKEVAAFVYCLLNSSLFYWFYSVFSDCEHINDALIRGFRIPDTWQNTEWKRLSESLSKDLEKYAQRKTIRTKQGHTIRYDEIKAFHSKPIFDEIDHVLAKHYGFTEEELDFIINYDIKYRMGQEARSEED